MYIQVDQDQRIVLTHQDPLNPAYGLNLSEEELRERGFFLDGVRGLPAVEDKEGFHVVYYFDGQKIWFDYEEAATKENLQRDVLRLVQEKAEQDRKIKESLEGLEAAKQRITDVRTEAVNASSNIEMDTGMLALDLMDKEMVIQAEKEKLLAVSKELVITKEKLAASEAGHSETKAQLAQTQTDLGSTQKDLADLVLMLLGGDL